MTFQSHFLIFQSQRQIGFRERVGYYKLNQVVTSISPAAIDVIFLLEQVNTSGHLISGIDLVHGSKDTTNSLHTASRSNKISLLSYPKAVSIMS